MGQLLPPLTAGNASWGASASRTDVFASDVGTVWEATQEMGEVLLIPPGWRRQCLHQDRSLSVSNRFITKACLPAVAQAVSSWLTLVGLEDPEKVFASAAAHVAVEGWPPPAPVA